MQEYSDSEKSEEEYKALGVVKTSQILEKGVGNHARKMIITK